MSRKSNKPIAIPDGVTVEVKDKTLTVKGPKGELQETIHPFVTIEVKDNAVNLSVKNPDVKAERSMWGTFGALVAVMIEGVVNGYTKQLEINGVGYGFDVSGKKLTVKAGYSHPVIVEIPDNVEIKGEKNVITLTSHDKQLVGQVAAEIRKIRKPEPYKGKGIKYMEEVIQRKQGKQAVGSE